MINHITFFLLIGALALKELSGQFTPESEVHTYEDNGWQLEYCKIGPNRLWFGITKTFGTLSSPLQNALVMAGLPFTPAYTTTFTIYMMVAYSYVGTGRGRLNTNHGVYMDVPSYAPAVTLQGYGEVIIKE